ncbi:uncharacterized protein LOC131302792 [Rhododendron vialii]|uniref:uncharacterized protein LOC131302792 n=1 Tax=Rhododendron vialii TaxID=182163 RepID=UPI0026602FFF|nr:uncharacterized protein LOC131302792 [Rhododendron vialii]
MGGGHKFCLVWVSVLRLSFWDKEFPGFLACGWIHWDAVTPKSSCTVMVTQYYGVHRSLIFMHSEQDNVLFAALVLQLAFRSHHQLASPELSDSQFLFHTRNHNLRNCVRSLFQISDKVLVCFTNLAID